MPGPILRLCISSLFLLCHDSITWASHYTLLQAQDLSSDNLALNSRIPSLTSSLPLRAVLRLVLGPGSGQQLPAMARLPPDQGTQPLITAAKQSVPATRGDSLGTHWVGRFSGDRTFGELVLSCAKNVVNLPGLIGEGNSKDRADCFPSFAKASQYLKSAPKSGLSSHPPCPGSRVHQFHFDSKAAPSSH